MNRTGQPLPPRFEDEYPEEAEELMLVCKERYEYQLRTGKRNKPMYLDGVETYVRDDPKVGRNDPCPCGSGKKFKKCCQ